MSDVYAALLQEAARLIVATPALAKLAGGPMPDEALHAPPPAHLPAADLVLRDESPTCPATAPLVAAIKNGASQLKWQHTYSEADGFNADFLDRSGWFNLASPDGAYMTPDFRLSIGYWGEGLFYNWHRHRPEEVYCVLAGRAVFLTEGRDPQHCGPGETVHHPSNIAHAAEMVPGPLLALALWRGESLTEKSEIVPPP